MSAHAAAQRAPDVDYEREKRLMSDPDIEVRRQVARNPATRPEILYYMATDKAVAVRCDIAANVQTPIHADSLLVKDADDSVRVSLAQKIATLLPGQSADQQNQAKERVYEIVSALARDQAVRVRQIMAEALKDIVDAPHDVIRGLAKDIELVVCEPILRCSTVLTDDDLREIIAAPPADGALTAIARRAQVAAPIADAIFAAGDENAVAALLANPSAQIREETLDLVVEQAPKKLTWHPGLVARPSLPSRIARRIASFVAATLLRELEQRTDLDPEARKAVSSEVERRLASEQKEADAPPEPKETAAEIVARLHAKGELTEDSVAAALDEGQRAFVKAALVLRSGLKEAMVDKIMSAHSAKGIVALAWKAELSPGLARQIQLRMGGIPPKQVLAPRAGGAWPLTPEEMTWHLEFFGA